MRFLCGFMTGVYVSKYYNFEPAIEYMESKVKELEHAAKKK